VAIKKNNNKNKIKNKKSYIKVGVISGKEIKSLPPKNSLLYFSL
jgi:hypothetical protein